MKVPRPLSESTTGYINKRRRSNRTMERPPPPPSSTHLNYSPGSVAPKANRNSLSIPPSALPAVTRGQSSPAKPPSSIESILAGQLSQETRRAYRSDLKHFLGYFGFRLLPGNDSEILAVLQKVNRTQVAEYRDSMLTDEELAAATVNRRMSNLGTIYDLLKEEGFIRKSPFYRVKRPKVGREGKTPALTRERAERILVQPDSSTPMGRRDRVLLLLLFFCGLRRGEVVKVTGEDFLEDQGHILLRIHGKGRSDKSDAVKIPPQIWPEIQTYIADTGTGLLFTGCSRNGEYNQKERAISPTRVYLMFQKYCRMAGIDPEAFSPHSVRTTFITLCLQGGADIRSVMYAARHSDPATTIRYDRARRNLDNHASQHLHLEI